MTRSAVLATLLLSSSLTVACGPDKNIEPASDAASADAAAGSDSGASDAQTVDGASSDAAAMDGSVRDAGAHDGATARDGAMHDSGMADSSMMHDSGMADGTAITDSAAPDAACAQPPVTLATAATFVVLAGSTVTSTGPTSVTGDLGTSPGTALVGFGPGTIVGVQHIGDPTAAQAEADVTTAYNDLAGRTLCAVSVAGNLGGQTLAPGLYTSTSSLAISSGDLTLDAMGDPNALFIFQTASTLTTTSGLSVILAGGAKSTNIYWQVGSSATLGTTSVFQGTILASQAVTMNTGATLNGRALAESGAVTLDSNTIVKPTP